MNKNKKANKKRWLILGAVGTALLLIPRRSSRQTSPSYRDLTTKSQEKIVDNKTTQTNYSDSQPIED